MDVKVYGYDTRGVYEWGRGFVSKAKFDAWKNFWDDVAENRKIQRKELSFWQVIKHDEYGCYILVTLGGSISIDPTDGKGVIKMLNEAEYDATFEEFRYIMDVCAKRVGCCIDTYSKKGVIHYER